MSIRKIVCLLTSCLLIVTVFVFDSSAWAKPATNVTGSSSRTTPNQLPRDQVKRFVTAIAAIKHYYIKNVSDPKLFSNAIHGMVSNLDPHSTFLTKADIQDLQSKVSGQFVGIGVELTNQSGSLKVISPLQGTPAARAGIKPDDLIIKVNGKLVQNMSLREAIKHIKGKKGTKVSLTILRKGAKKPIHLTITRDTIKLEAVKSKMLENGYGYVRITFFQGPVDKELREAIKKLKTETKGHLKGFILDLRNNPGGLLDESAQVADTFLDSRKIRRYRDLIVYTKGRIKGSDIKFKATPGDLIAGVPMVVLINGGSASASEIVAGALQDYQRAVVMGTRSFGKGSVQTIIPIGLGSAIKLTTALYHTPAGRVIQAQGIEPNVAVPELQVNEKSISGLLDIDESDYQNHLNNDSATKLSKQKLLELKQQKAEELKLAKSDYQLYEALMMLKGLHALKPK